MPSFGNSRPLGSLGNKVSPPTANNSGAPPQSAGSPSAPSPSQNSYVIQNTTTGNGSQTVDKWGYAIAPVGMGGIASTFSSPVNSQLPQWLTWGLVLIFVIVLVVAVLLLK